jgi:hypothetical protein
MRVDSCNAKHVTSLTLSSITYYFNRISLNIRHIGECDKTSSYVSVTALLDLTEIGVWIELLEKSRLHWTNANHNSTDNVLAVTTPLPPQIATLLNFTKTC